MVPVWRLACLYAFPSSKFHVLTPCVYQGGEKKNVSTSPLPGFCWSKALEGTSPSVRRQLSPHAPTCARLLRRDPQGGAGPAREAQGPAGTGQGGAGTGQGRAETRRAELGPAGRGERGGARAGAPAGVGGLRGSPRAASTQPTRQRSPPRRCPAVEYRLGTHTGRQMCAVAALSKREREEDVTEKTTEK